MLKTLCIWDYLYDESNPDWLPLLHLGHSKKAESNIESTERWERRVARNEASFNRLEAAQSLLSLGESSHMESTVPNEEKDREEKTGTVELTLTSIEKMHQKQVQLSGHKATFSKPIMLLGFILGCLT